MNSPAIPMISILALVAIAFIVLYQTLIISIRLYLGIACLIAGDIKSLTGILDSFTNSAITV